MKIFLAAFMLLLQQPVFAFEDSHLQNQAIVQLNDICGDTWCESSVDFVFQKIQCSFDNGQCLLDFTTQQNNSPDQPIEIGHCLMTEIHSNEQLFDLISPAQGGDPMPFLKSSFLDQVNNCLASYIK